MNPLVSVIIPTKNSARTLDACLRSLVKQSYKNIEIIVIDNFSSDATMQIATANGARVAQVGNERSAQRNKGAQVSKGAYLLFVDSDMEVNPRVIERCVIVMEQKASIRAIIIPEESFGKSFWAQCKRFERSFYEHVPWMQAVRFFRKDTYDEIGGFDENMIGAEDFDIHNRIMSMFGEKSIATIFECILHNEGALSLRATFQKKWYYGSYVRPYKNKQHNKRAYKKQFSLLSRLFLLCSQPKKSIVHPLLFFGTIVMKTGEFVAGGIGYITAKDPHSNTEDTSLRQQLVDEKTLPSVSFVTCTLNSGRLLEECLTSIASLDYPKHLIETIVVDGGSTDSTREIATRFQCTIIDEHTGRPEAATAIGYSTANHDIIVNFPSDNVITDPSWLKRMVQPFYEQPDIVGSYTLRYEYRREDTPLNRCFALFGAGDPVAYYMNKRDRVAYFEQGYPQSDATKDCGNYYLAEFSRENIPTLGANGFLIRRGFARLVSKDPMAFFHIDSMVDLISQGHTKFAIVKTHIWHRTGEHLTTFFKRRIRYISIYFQDKKLRRYHIVDMRTDTWKLAAYVFYSLTFVEPTLEAVRGYIIIRDWAWFLHPIMSFLCVPIYSYALGRAVLRNALYTRL